MNFQQLCRFFKKPKTTVDLNSFEKKRLLVDELSGNTILFNSDTIELIRNSKEQKIICFYKPEKTPLGAITYDELLSKITFDGIYYRLNTRYLQRDEVPKLKVVTQYCFNHLPSDVHLSKFSKKSIDERIEVYNKHFFNFYSSPSRFLDGTVKVQFELPEAKSGTADMCSCNNCVSFFSFLKVVKLLEPTLIDKIIEFELLLHRHHEDLFLSSVTDNKEQKVFKMTVMEYMSQPGNEVLSNLKFSKGHVFLEKDNYISMKKKLYKETLLKTFCNNHLVESLEKEIEKETLHELAPKMKFLSEIDSLKKRTTRASNVMNIKLSQENRPSLKEAHEKDLLPWCSSDILDQIKKAGKASYILRYALGNLYDLGYSIEDISSYLRVLISVDKFDEEMREIEKNHNKYWSKSSNCIRRFYPGNMDEEKSTVCSRACSRMITDKDAISNQSGQYYGCPFVRKEFLEKKASKLIDIEDLVKISEKPIKDETDVNKIKDACSNCFYKKHGLHTPKFGHSNQVFLTVLVDRENDMEKN